MKAALTILVALSLLAVPVMVQGQAASAVRPVIKTLGVLGKGIAVSPSDPLDFKMVKAGIATVRVSVLGEETELTVGILYLDEDRYKLKDIVKETGSVTANLYQNDSQVGDLSLSSVTKANTEVWAGTLNVNGAQYYLYILEAPRPIRANEIRDKVSEYCRDNPDDTNCRNKVVDYCRNNPDDRRCREVFRRYCLQGNNLQDARCRNEITEYCKENKNARECVTYALERSRKYCSDKSNTDTCRKIGQRVVDFCQSHPDSAACTKAKQIMEDNPRLLQKLNTIRERIISIRSPAAAPPALTSPASPLSPGATVGVNETLNNTSAETNPTGGE